MYSSWAVKRRAKITIFFSVVGFVIFAAYIIISMYKVPTCFDEKRNQDEFGKDCGGICDLMCSFQIQPLKTTWARSFKAIDSMWSSVAYIENSNPQAYVEKAKYRFSIYDRENNLITKKEGVTYISEDPILPIYHGRINIKNGILPYRTKFEWIEPLVWMRTDNLYKVVIEEQKLSNTHSEPELTATLVNKEPYDLKDIEIVAIVYDVHKNAVATSKTHVDVLSARGKRHITFSWPNAFDSNAERWQLIARVPHQEN